MKAMGFAQKVLTDITKNSSKDGLTVTSSTSGTPATSNIDLGSDFTVYNSKRLGNYLASDYAKKNDPEASVIFRKLKLKNPYPLSSPANDDYLCAFDANDGELSKTNLKVKDVANIDATYAKKSDPISAYSSGSAIKSLESDKNSIVSCIKGLFGNTDSTNYYYGICTTYIWISGDDRRVLTIDAANYRFSKINAVIPIPVKTNGVPNTGGSTGNPFIVRKVSDTKWEVYVDFYDSSRFDYCYALIIGRNYYDL